jgi:hypothetical protein
MLRTPRRSPTASSTADPVNNAPVTDEGASGEVEKLVNSGALAGDSRWPRWGPRIAADLGLRSMLCIQLFTNEDQMGALNVYSGEPDALDEDAREIARLLAAYTAVTVLAAQEIATLKVAVDRRTTSEKGFGTSTARYVLPPALDFGRPPAHAWALVVCEVEHFSRRRGTQSGRQAARVARMALGAGT